MCTKSQPFSTSSMAFLNINGAFTNPNGIKWKLNVPNLNTNAVNFRQCADISNCQYPETYPRNRSIVKLSYCRISSVSSKSPICLRSFSDSMCSNPHKIWNSCITSSCAPDNSVPMSQQLHKQQNQHHTHTQNQ